MARSLKLNDYIWVQYVVMETSKPKKGKLISIMTGANLILQRCWEIAEIFGFDIHKTRLNADIDPESGLMIVRFFQVIA